MGRRALACQVALLDKVLQHCIRSVTGLETVRKSVFWPWAGVATGILVTYFAVARPSSRDFTNFQAVARLAMVFLHCYFAFARLAIVIL
jgi:hypothetical protein